MSIAKYEKYYLLNNVIRVDVWQAHILIYIKAGKGELGTLSDMVADI